jgi:benzodiazapine receptor
MSASSRKTLTLTSDPTSNPMTIRSRSTQITGLVVWLAVTFVAAAIGSAASIHAGPFYLEMTRPEWAPPPGIFGPVWSVLYVLMGLAAWLVWRNTSLRAARVALVLFISQLALNALWSWLFFGWHLGVWAFADVVLLWAAVLATIRAFWTIRPLAGLLLAPYLLWVSFAAALNYSVWKLNPHLLG